MVLETKPELDEATVAKLQDLIRINIDSQKGFEEAIDVIDDSSVSSMFQELANQRAQSATVLQEYVKWNEEEPAAEGSYAAALHRIWIDLRGKLNGGDAHVILCEAERGEDQIKKAYEDALKETAGSAMNDVLQQHYENVKAGHDRVRDTRDAFAASK